MKLQQNHVQCNSAVNINDILNAYVEATTSLHALLKSKQHQALDTTTQLELSKTDTNSTDIFLADSFGRLHAFPLNKGHSCVIGQDHEQLTMLAQRLQNYLTDNGKASQIISLSDFVNISSSTSRHKDLSYIVLFNNTSLGDKLTDFEGIANLFSNFFVFALLGLSISCSLNGVVRSNVKTNRILFAIKGNISLRKYMISALSANEFVAMTAGKETIRTLTTLKN